jgi:hypothetical protein
MRCRTARRKLLELELCDASRPAGPRLARHLANCADCAAERRAHALLVRGLRSLRSATPFEVDVRAVVLRNLVRDVAESVPGAGPVDRGTLAWLGAGLAGIFAALAWGALRAPALAAGAGEAWSIAAALGRVMLHVGRVWGTTLAAGLRTALEWTASASAFASDTLGVSIRSLSFWAAFAMIVLTAAALLYDVRRGVELSEQEPLR